MPLGRVDAGSSRRYHLFHVPCEVVGYSKLSERRGEDHETAHTHDYSCNTGSAAGDRGQPVEKVWRIGFLGETAAPIAGVPQHPVIDAFVEALRERGYIDDRNLKIEYRFDQGDRLPIQAAELVGLKLDLIVAVGTREALALKSATSTTPIVMLFPGDPVGAGLGGKLGVSRRQHYRHVADDS